jgi:hypothetical protein
VQGEDLSSPGVGSTQGKMIECHEGISNSEHLGFSLLQVDGRIILRWILER